MTEQLLAQQLESPSGTGRVDPEVKSDSQAPQPTSGIPPSRHPILTGSSGALGREASDARRSDIDRRNRRAVIQYQFRCDQTAAHRDGAEGIKGQGA